MPKNTEENTEEIIELAGGTATLWRITHGLCTRKARERRVSLAELARAVAGRDEARELRATPMLPAGTRAHLTKGPHEILVFEEAPQLRTILFDRETCHLAFPYVVYVLYWHNGRMPKYTSRIFFRTAPLASLNDDLFLCNLHHANVGVGWEKGALCSPDTGTSGQDTLEKKVAETLAYYWHTNFHMTESDSNGFFMGFAVGRNADARIGSLERWQAESRKDPLFVLGMSWPKTGLTARAVIEKILEDRSTGRREAASGRTITETRHIADLMYRLQEVE